MIRTMLIATGVVLVAVLAYFAVIGRDGDARTTDGVPSGGAATEENAEAVVDENISNRTAADIATDGAVESARQGEDPVQGSLDASRAAAEAAGAVGAAAFTAQGYDRQTVLSAIEDTELSEARKDELRNLLTDTDPDSQAEMEETLAAIRAALEEG